MSRCFASSSLRSFSLPRPRSPADAPLARPAHPAARAPRRARPRPAGASSTRAAARCCCAASNVNALVEYWQYGAFATTFPFDRRRTPIASPAIGWNAVRLLVSWSRVEPAPGHVRRGVPRRRSRGRARCSRAAASTRSSTSTRTRGVRRSRRAPDEVCPPASIRRSAGTARPGGRRSTAVRARCVPAGIRGAEPGRARVLRRVLGRRRRPGRRRHPHALREHARSRRGALRRRRRRSPATTS